MGIEAEAVLLVAAGFMPSLFNFPGQTADGGDRTCFIAIYVKTRFTLSRAKPPRGIVKTSVTQV